MLLGDILRKNGRSELFGNKTALIFGERVWTYAALNTYANQIGNALLQQGVARGDRVAALARDSDFCVALYFALAKIGAIMVPVNYWYRADEVRYTLDQSGSGWLIADARYRAVAEGATAKTAEPIRTIWHGESVTPSESAASLDSLLQRAS